MQNKYYYFLTYETEFVLFLAVLENSVLPMGWDSSRETLCQNTKFQKSRDFRTTTKKREMTNDNIGDRCRPRNPNPRVNVACRKLGFFRHYPFILGLGIFGLHRRPVIDYICPKMEKLGMRQKDVDGMANIVDSELNDLRKIICLRKYDVSVERISVCNVIVNLVEHSRLS